MTQPGAMQHTNISPRMTMLVGIERSVNVGVNKDGGVCVNGKWGASIEEEGL